MVSPVEKFERIINHRGPFRNIFGLLCMIAVSLDALFFYIPVINGDRKCLELDQKLKIAATVLRSFTDIFYMVCVIFQIQRTFSGGKLVEDAWAIARRYLSLHFLIDILVVLPMPQVVILIIIPNMAGSRSLNTQALLKFVIFFQFIPRVFRVYPLYKQVRRTAWAGAALNLVLYMLASHVLGAFWYLSAVERETTCWQKACRVQSECVPTSLYCDGSSTGFKSFLYDSCPIQTPNTTRFDFGIFLEALQSGRVESTDFHQKFGYCFWWGLQNLSSLGQNLKTSTYVWENYFAVFIAISGLVLFSFLIGNMQKYLQNSERLEEMRVERRDIEKWMSRRSLPQHLREQIIRHEQFKWQKTDGVDEDYIISRLPKNLRRVIKRHLCFDLLMRVPMFEKMDEHLLDAMCDYLKPVFAMKDSFMVREGDPVEEMMFVFRGKLLLWTKDGRTTGFSNSCYLKDGDFCGEELLTWALDPASSNLPLSTRTVQALSEEVEVFALMAEDLKYVASQFRRLHGKQLQHIFRFYSHKWRTWATCFIQAAWRRYCRKKREEPRRRPWAACCIQVAWRRHCRKKREEEDRLQHAVAVTQENDADTLQKPAEPDFAAVD